MKKHKHPWREEGKVFICDCVMEGKKKPELPVTDEVYCCKECRDEIARLRAMGASIEKQVEAIHVVCIDCLGEVANKAGWKMKG